MKTFRHIVLSAAVTAGIFSTLLYASCNKDKCGSTVCDNGAVCTENVCICPTGFSGSNCNTSWSGKWQGVYNCTQTCVPAYTVPPWQSTITADPTNGGYTIDISNFDGDNNVVIANVDSVSGLSIIPTAGTSGVDGNGTYVDSANHVTITLIYTTSSGSVQSGNYTCKIIMTKQ